VPLSEQARLIGRVAEWLRPGGFLLATLGAGEAHEEVEEDWLGAPMFFASLDGEAYPPLLRATGLEPLRDEIVVQHEPGYGEVAFRWVLARAAA
jgi:hypothetical protein